MSGDEIRERIKLLLKAVPVRMLGLEDASLEAFTKAGVLPFLPAPAMENWRFLLMQPVATQSHLEPPKFQLAKGTRMENIGGQWQDIQGPVTGYAEALVETALREGNEELGLDLTHVARLFDAGPVSFTSAKTGQIKRMWLFAAEMRKPECLLPAARVAPTTAARAWLPPGQLMERVRPDHVAIILQTASQLCL